MNTYLLELIDGKKVDYDTKRGIEVYHSSLQLLLKCAASELYPELKIQIANSLMKGYYFEPADPKELIPEDFVSSVHQRMCEIISLNEKFCKFKLDKNSAINLFKKQKRLDKVRTLQYYPKKNIPLVKLRSYVDFMLTEFIVSTKYLSCFDIKKYNNGFILQFPVQSDPSLLPKVHNKERKLYRAYEESKKWSDILKIHHVPDLNEAVANGDISMLIKVQEAFHEKKIAAVADKITALYPEKKLVFVAGPSASGKTTFLKRLGVQIRANGYFPQEINLDNYFVDRDKTPKNLDGSPDFECPEALDLKYFQNQVAHLLDGKKISIPKYDFKTGKRVASGKTLKLQERSIVLIEGIHGLNPKISNSISEKLKYKIFINALTQLYIDNDTRLFKSDARLMRRIIRDSRYRNYSAVETINRFPKVRLGENTYIFPFQDRADIFFNTSAIYEQAVFKPLIKPLLTKIRKNEQGYYEARRLLNYLDFMSSISSEEVPQTSILREFIGSSFFQY